MPVMFEASQPRLSASCRIGSGAPGLEQPQDVALRRGQPARRGDRRHVRARHHQKLEQQLPGFARQADRRSFHPDGL